ncbi:MAG: BatD family protein, partial [Gammaproteobacteria bacterium]
MSKLKTKTGILFLSHSLLLFSMLATAIVQAANITVTASRNPVTLDSSFHLVYEADSSVDDDPDFSPVYTNFDVLSSSQSTNMRSINGSWSLKKSWDLTLISKEVGRFTIPAINFGKDISPAIQLTVSNSTSPNQSSPQGQASIPAKIFLEGSIDKKSGWIQSQFVYSVRLFRTVNITGASLTEPETSDADAIIRLLSEDRYQSTRKGLRYEVIERRYAIFPQKSGVLKIKPITFEGRVNATQPRSIFDQFRMSGQLKRLRSKTIEVTVKAAPKTINLQDWLPASEVQLVEEWSADIQNLTAGEPVTRTVMIAAQGLTGLQLPDLEFDDINGLKQYPDKPVIEDKTDSTGITGYKQVKVALIPARAGTYTLPEIKLQWWNTKTSSKEFAIIPQTVITAIASINTDNNNITTPTPVENKTPLNEKLSSDNKTKLPVTAVASDQAYWKWLAAFFAVAWLYTLILLLKNSKTNRSIDKAKTANPSISVKSVISAVAKHAKNNDAESTRLALIEWAKTVYTDNTIINLSQITKYCSPQLA